MKATITLVSVAVLVLMAFMSSAETAKILAIFPFPGPSQYIAVLPYLKTLASRGHELTVINTFPQKEKIKNFRDIPALDIHKNYDVLIADISKPRSKWEEMSFFLEFFIAVNLNVFENKGVQELLNSNATFDLIISQAEYNDPLYGFAQHFNAPIIGFSSYGTDVHIDNLVGNTSPSSYVPYLTGDLTDHMNFWQRLKNLYIYGIEWLHGELVAKPRYVEVYKRFFPNAKVGLPELRKKFSLILLNQHFSLSFPRPYVPNMIEVGGMHLNQQTAALPAEMEAFLQKSKEGVVYFSMGSNIKSKELPDGMLIELLQIFAALPQNVLFKYEDDELPDKPANVFISKWFPQPDVLAHPKVKLFITHGGLLSTIEAIYHGKPVVGIPVFYDQFLNVARVTNAGFGLGVDLKNLTALKPAIESILNNPSYAAMAVKMSKRYRDQPMAPLDKAIFWTEYVLRHKGAPHMRVAAQNLSFVEYHNLDVLGLIVGGLLLAVVFSVVLLRKLLRLIFHLFSTKLVKAKQQ